VNSKDHNKKKFMAIERKLEQVYTPKGQPGFLGAGHIARPVIERSFAESDPFIMLMDDILDKKDTNPVGGPHPHAGFETVTLMIEGELGVGAHKLKSGDFQMMTAGSGIVHTETIDSIARLRLFQLWLNLPRKHRWTRPRLQDLPVEHVPGLSKDGVHIKLYSGSLAGLKSSLQNYAPVIIADISIDPGLSTVQEIPADFNTFLYVINGSVKVGEDERNLGKDQVGWLNLLKNEEQSVLRLTAGEQGTRFILYAGKPSGEPIVSHGPFIADSSEDIMRLYQEYRQGKMKHVSTLPEEQKIAL
jgi:redox-sensitive bicupin YhaK (pirin superfamily)